jgi:hypothetical protein
VARTQACPGLSQDQLSQGKLSRERRSQEDGPRLNPAGPISLAVSQRQVGDPDEGGSRPAGPVGGGRAGD